MRPGGRNVTALLSLGLAIAAFAGCGSDSGSTTAEATAKTPAEKAIAGVIAKYEEATKTHDAVLFCKQVLPNEKHPANGENPKQCPGIIKTVMKDPTSTLAKPVTIVVTDFGVDGDSANVKAELNGKPETLPFANGENGWRLAGLG